MLSEPEASKTEHDRFIMLVCIFVIATIMRCECQLPHDRCMACVFVCGGRGEYSNLNAELKQDLLSIVSGRVFLEPGM